MSERFDRLEWSRAVTGPHSGQAVLTAGVPIEAARIAVVLIHGRGATADDLLPLRNEWRAEQVSFLAPQAADFAWYPHSFLAPLEANQPHLDSGLELIGALSDEVSSRGVPRERQLLLGFSQGGCLALEFAGRNACKWGGVVGLSEGLIGPPGRDWAFTGSLDGAPVFLGCSDHDPHIPRERVEASAIELRRIGGEVESRLYSEFGHSVNRDELSYVQGMLDRLA
ncbi:MAG: phospholipase [Candidatus Eisenbacteria bacterium]|uniref:Phospholipase n=1 Tax=Eiseniibacteriota bacterium TaxID=2212470 RepID=A0A849SRL2_UNCEI|nr:phospholipase [Candidatus Eisenbacteria bacterium]